MVWHGATNAQFARLEKYEGDAYTWAEATVEMHKAEENQGKKGKLGLTASVRVFVARNAKSAEIQDGEWSMENFQNLFGR